MENQKINQNNNYYSDGSYDSAEQIIYEQGVGEYFSKDEYELECEREYEADRQLYLSTNSDSACWDGLKCFVANLEKQDREELNQMKTTIKKMKQQLKLLKDNSMKIHNSYNLLLL